MDFSVRSENAAVQEERRLADSNRWNPLQDSNCVRDPLAIDCLRPLRKAGRTAFIADESGCWLWNGTINSRGYGVRGTKDSRYLVHRRVFEEITGVEIPEGIQIHHVCGTRRCVNPLHLRALDAIAHSREHGGPSLRERVVALVTARGRVTGADVGELAAVMETTVANVQTMLARAATRGEIRRVERGVYEPALTGRAAA